MARYEHLPIYKKAMDVAVYMEKVVAGFSRYHKYTLGTDLRNKSKEIVSLIVKANSTQNKLSILHDLRGELEALIILIRMSKGPRKNNFTFSHLIFKPSLSDLHALNPQCGLGYACGSARSDRPNLA